MTVSSYFVDIYILNTKLSIKRTILKILIINYEHPPLGGGGGVSTQSLAQALVKKGHTVHILTTGTKDLPKETDEEGVKIFRVPVLFRKDLKTASDMSMLTFPITSIPKGLKLCIKYKYDIINTHFYAPSGPTGMVLSFLTRIPNVLYVHGADVYDPTRINKTPAGKGILSWLLRINARMQNRFAKALACQSSNTKGNVIEYIKPKKEVNIIPLPFNIPDHPKAIRKDIGLKEKNYYLLSAGRAVKRKGYNFLIEAMTNLSKNIHCVIIGDGPEIPELQKLAEKLGIEDRVHLLGYVEKEEDKFKYYDLCDLYVLSSVHEGMGIVIQEAMEFGMPVVATNHGGQVDLIQDGVNGILVDPCDSKILADAIDKVYKDKKLSNKYGKKNTEFIKKYYSDSIADMFLELYSKHLKKK